MRCNAGHSDREVLKGTLKHVYVNLWARATGQGRCLDKGASLTEPLTSERLKPEADQKHVFPRHRRLESRRVSANRDKEPLSRLTLVKRDLVLPSVPPLAKTSRNSSARLSLARR